MDSTNEPVAWIFGAHLDSAKKMPHLCRVTPTQENENYIPLYTHPVKKLTQQEIDKVIQENKHKCLIDICRAVIRKASEK